MKPIAKILCCGLMLAWVHSAMAATTPPAPKKKPHMTNSSHDRKSVEKRLENKGLMAKKRADEAKKAAPK